MSVPAGIFKFAAALLPELVKLFRKHRGNAAEARRDMRSLTDEIAADRRAVDAEIERQRRGSAPGGER